LEVKTSRKLVLTYEPLELMKYHNIEMKFATLARFEDEIPGRIFPNGDIDIDYVKHIKEVCDTLNEEIEKLVDHAKFHIVEVSIIK